MKLSIIAISIGMLAAATSASRILRPQEDLSFLDDQWLGNIYYALGECLEQKDSYSAFRGCVRASELFSHIPHCNPIVPGR
ncbi:hypothetical protein DL95DRAFT_466203 [Leptodontidium sp. 2 PMI_412]|nr:hypothetical protein DL95DRAFT_466203 [Leptodontidium sp. 2 PMI_412]